MCILSCENILTYEQVVACACTVYTVSHKKRSQLSFVCNLVKY